MAAWISLRVSTDEQADSGAGINAQTDACRAWADRHGIAVAGVFSDEGVSGASGIDKRPALLEAIASMQKGDILLVAKRDRLGRDPFVVAMIEAAVRRKGGRVVSAAGEGTDGDGPTDILMRRIIDAFSEYERLVIKSRTRQALQAKKRRGERVGQLPLGHDLADDGVRLVASESEQSTIATIREWRQRGMTLQAITDRLNAEKVPTKKGGRWHLTTVDRILRAI